MQNNDLLPGLISELRRGSLTLAVLCMLRNPLYGYALLTQMQQQGVEVEANTLYPLLRRLENQGLLKSDWDMSESRPRKYYATNEKGGQVLAALLNEWRRLTANIEAIYGKDECDE